MLFRSSSAAALLLAASLLLPIGTARALDGDPYPDWRGQWVRVDGGHGPQFDPGKPPGRGQQVPLNAEYQAIFEANLKNLATGTQPYNPQLGCLPPGMPRTMILYEPMELIVTPATTYMAFSFMNDLRRIYTDGRDWPASVEPSFVSTAPRPERVPAGCCAPGRRRVHATAAAGGRGRGQAPRGAGRERA